jgi:hypothetical protein
VKIPAFLLLCAISALAEELPFNELFADPQSRPAAIATLTPGTRDHFFYTALDHQLNGREADYTKAIAAWKAASELKDSRVSDSGLGTLENRRILSAYDKSPKAALDELTRVLDLKFDARKPDSAATDPDIPSSLDQQAISAAAFQKAAELNNPRAPYTTYSEPLLYAELDSLETFSAERIRWFAENFSRPDHPRYTALLTKALALKPPFESSSIEYPALTIAQLDELAKSTPSLLSVEEFNLAYLAKLRPAQPTKLDRHPEAHAAFLAACKDYAMKLPPSQNSLKAHILFHHLNLQEALGKQPLADLLAYLAYPRQDIFGKPLTPNSKYPVDTDEDFSDASGCRPIGNDSDFVERQIHHHLGQSDTAQQPFVPLIAEKKLAVIHARARLLAGADPTRWAGSLSPEEFKSLREEIRIGFSPTAPNFFSSTDKVALPLDLKNTPSLLIRIYEISGNATSSSPLLDLDGLVPHHTRTLTFPQAPIVQHRENIALPELEGAGTWLVEFVADRTSARVMIRKGNLTPHITRTTAGQLVRLFDENSQAVPDFKLSLGTENFTAKDGTVTVPNAANQASTAGIITAGKRSTQISLSSREDSYALESDFLLDREQLLANRNATLHIRSRLTNHGQPADIALLKTPTLVLKATLLGGITTERVIADPLPLAATNEIPFLVPADLLSLTLTLSATVTPATSGEEEVLTQSTTYQLNGALETSRIATALFSPTTSGHQLHLRGRNGEPLADRPVSLEIFHKLYEKPVKATLRTGASGTIALGTLADISSLTATSPDIVETTYVPPIREVSIPEKYVIPSGRELRIPRAFPSDLLDPSQAVFYQITKSGDDETQAVRNLFSNLTADDNQLTIKELAPGNYLLIQDDGSETEITVLPTDSLRGDLLATADEIMPLIAPATPSILSALAEGENLTIRIANASPETRVTVIARRYFINGWDPGNAAFPFATGYPDALTRAVRPSGYVTERKISDEMRYILDRRNATTFPGSMLPRPGQLLFPWTPDDLDQEEQSGGGGFGGLPQSMPDGGGGSNAIPSAMRKRRENNSHPTAIDFLQFPSAVKFNLTPDAEGNITIPRADLQGAQFIEIIAADTHASDTAFLPLAPSETALTDRRLARALDPKSHHLPTRFAAALAPGAEATINNLLDADWRAFTTLAEAHQFLLATSGDDRIRTFTPIATWPDLDETEKLAFLTAHRCHELHLFLSRKDPAFYGKHVKPFLAAKPQPQFIDDYLLARDLTGYLRPYAFSRLNAAEKALLAQALPASKADISRELDLRWKSEAPSPEAETILFSQTLKGADLSPTDSLGLARNRNSIPGIRSLTGVFSDGADFISPVNGVSIPGIPPGSDEVSNIVTSGLRSGDQAVNRNSIDAILNNPDRFSGPTDGVSYLSEKLRHIVIPSIDFEDTSIEEAIDFLRLRSKELDTLELDPGKKGLNFVVRNPQGGNARIPELRLRNVPISVALKYIADATKMRYKVDDYAVTLVPQTETGEDLFTRTFRVPPDFASTLSSDGNDTAQADPFADASTRGGALLSPRTPIIELLKQAGIVFPEGSSATLGANGQLLVTGPPSELDKIEQLTEAFSASPAPSDESLDMGSLDAAPGSATGRAVSRPRLFPDRTRLWLESNYYKHRGMTDETLIPLNRFWLELSAWDGKAPFTSPHFNACTRSAAEALMCLAMLDLPFTAEKPEVTADQNTLKVKARAPMLLFYKDTRLTENIAPESPLLVRQSYHPLAEPFRTDEQDRRIENTVTGDFRTGVPYGLSLVVTNPTGTERRIETLAQIPAGAIPLASLMPHDKRTHAPETLSTSHKLEPYGVVQLQLAFYFPAPGDYPAYPLHVSEGEQILAHAQPRTLRVSADPAPEDSASWLVLARDGTAEAVLNRLSTENLSTINLAAILWRLRDRDFFLKATEILRKRLQNTPEVFAYSILHNDPATLPDFIENTPLAKNLGQWFSSKLITITPTTHHGWETMEFDPLVNPRSHPFGANPRLSHAQAREHYSNFLDTLAWKPALTSADELTFTYFLFLQDRIGEALARFAKIKPADLPDPLQYDYLHAVALFYQEKPAEATAIAAPYLAKLPPGTWRDRFASVTAQADEISKPIAAAPEGKKETSPSLEIAAVEKDLGLLMLRHANLPGAEIRLYNIDLEILFSKDPFMKGGIEATLPPIAPNLSVYVPFAKDTPSTIYTMPKEFGKGNVLVAAESESTKHLKILDSRLLETTVIPADRAIQITDPATKAPLPKTYVKVYAESRDGTIAFHKDGYTDLRGKFDYLSHTATDPSTILRLAVLISHPEKGSRTQIIQHQPGSSPPESILPPLDLPE